MARGKSTILFAETIGTFVLVLGGCGTAVLAGSKVGYLGVSIAFGLTLLCMAYAIGGISGCHINPAVTLGMVIAKKCKPKDAPYYVIGQLIGGILAGAVIFGIAVSQTGATAASVRVGGFASNGYGAHSPELYKLIAAVLVEIVLTALLVFVVASTFHANFPGGFGGIAVGLVLTLIHLISIPVDNTSVNPARSIGVAVFEGGWALSQLWVFIVFPLIGAAIGALVWRVLAGDDEVQVEAVDATRYE
ncbi:MAG: aquaporin Z [Actinomycetes bacterium]